MLYTRTYHTCMHVHVYGYPKRFLKLVHVHMNKEYMYLNIIENMSLFRFNNPVLDPDAKYSVSKYLQMLSNEQHTVRSA